MFLLSDYRTAAFKKLSDYRIKASINRTIGYQTYEKEAQARKISKQTFSNGSSHGSVARSYIQA